MLIAFVLVAVHCCCLSCLLLQRVEVKLVNYKKDGSAFLNRLRITPLTTSLGQYTHMLGILEEVPQEDAAASISAPAKGNSL